jgi:hypothetical protein
MDFFDRIYRIYKTKETGSKSYPCPENPVNLVEKIDFAIFQEGNGPHLNLMPKTDTMTILVIPQA